MPAGVQFHIRCTSPPRAVHGAQAVCRGGKKNDGDLAPVLPDRSGILRRGAHVVAAGGASAAAFTRAL